ncbi:MAG: uracil-DNA glycosylase [Planctomycetota bacterium]
MNRHARRHLEMERLFGADFLPLSRSRAPKRPPPAPRPAKAASARPTEVPAGPSEPPEFLEFRRQVLACTKCGLAGTRTQVVFGVGPLGAPLMFIGEAPGEDEDRQGEPFVGRAGQLLTRTLEKLGVRRNQVYIANILKCRPPGNRTPQFDEMAACMPWLLRQIAFVNPRILCALGNIAAQTLLNTRTGITRLRGRYTEAHGRRVFCTFHPAYILRNMGDLPLFEADLRTVCRDLGLGADGGGGSLQGPGKNI